MQIAQVDLENAKSYRRESIVFTTGTNAICGPNGAGKSTLLEAVGFALFDFLPTTQGQFVREGEKTATVTVHLVDDDGRIYHVVRRCGSSSQYYVYDPEIDHKVVDGKGDTMVWLHEFLGVEETGDLAALFQDAVGVPQGLLTAAFLDRPANRKNTFNPLLRVDEYERAWGALRDPLRQLDESINEEEKRIAGFEAEVKVLPGRQEKATGLREAIAADKERQGVLQTELEEVTQRKEALEAVKQRLDELNQAVTQAEADVKTLEAQKAEAQETVQRAREAQSVVEETKAGHEAYLVAQANLEGLEGQRKKRDHLNEKRQQHATDLALARQQIERLVSDLAKIGTAEADMKRFQPQVEVQERLEKELTKAQRAAERLTHVEQNLVQEQARLNELEEKLTRVRAGLAQLSEVEEKTKSLRGELEDLDKQQEVLVIRIATTRTTLDQLQAQTASLEEVETAECPLCEGPLTPEHRAELLARNRTQQEELVTTLSETKSQREDIKGTWQEKQTTLRELEGRAKELPRPAEVDEISTQIDAQKETVQEVKTAVADLANAPAETERLQAELEDLGDPRRDYQRAVDVAARREVVEKDLTETREQVADLGVQIAALDKELSMYADLDEHLVAERATREAHEPDHQRYLEHIREAGALEERLKKVQALDEKLESVRGELEQVVEGRDKVTAEYDADAYAELVETYTSLRDETATLEERLRQQRDQLAEAQAEIGRLMGVQDALGATQAEVEVLRELLTLLKYIRQVLRDAGPKVTQALVEVISLQAAQLYADIMADHTTRLRWTDDYEIMLTSSGRERTFQQLSGGEQMAAALAVRLALLREVSAIDVAFFDEPTANLDDHRRDNLAEQILNVKGFSQLFVISHDDTFERDTDHVVRVMKESGVSRVEA